MSALASLVQATFGSAMAPLQRTEDRVARVMEEVEEKETPLVDRRHAAFRRVMSLASIYPSHRTRLPSTPTFSLPSRYKRVGQISNSSYSSVCLVTAQVKQDDQILKAWRLY